LLLCYLRLSRTTFGPKTRAWRSSGAGSNPPLRPGGKKKRLRTRCASHSSNSRRKRATRRTRSWLSSKPAVSKIKIGKEDATYQDITGTYLKKFPPFDPNAKITKAEDYRQIYVIFEGKEAVYSLTLLGPAKTVEKHKKDFDAWLKNFK
jgi:hypothetical protein